MNLNLLILVLSSFVNLAYSQEIINAGPRITALGNSGVAIRDLWSLQSNQAGLADVARPVAAIAFQSNYLNPDLSTKSAVFACPVKSGVWGVSLQNYGFSAYNTQKAGVAFARAFGSSVSIALNFNFHQISIRNYGSAQTYSIEAGLQFKAAKDLLIGTHISNPNKNAFNKDANAVIPTILEVGASYKLSDKVLLNSGLIKDLGYLTDVRFGLEYRAVDWFSLRGGIDLNPFVHFVGIGCNYQDLRIDLAASSHPNLGYSPQLAISYEF